VFVPWRLAMRSDGTVISWGNNSYGQLSIPDLGATASVAAGYYHTLAIVPAWLNYSSTPSGLVLWWDGPFVLQSSGLANGTYMDLPVSSPHTNSWSASPAFFRLREAK
jgi:hypothetical protein